VWGDAHDLVRTVARYGLLARITRDRGPDSPTILEVTGPLAVFHLTTVYGRALAALIPLLAEYARFTLEIHGDVEGRQQVLRVEPPILLPAVPAPRRRAPSIAERLARDLADAGYEVEREPSPLTSGDRLLFPELATEHAGTRWLIEIVPFCTAEYLASKLASYRDAGIDCSPGGDRVVLCIDSARAPVSLRRNTLPFARRVEVAELEKVFAMEIVS
jgi:predicted nuclease of restriction endonuclease-like RecB superfamily